PAGPDVVELKASRARDGVVDDGVAGQPERLDAVGPDEEVAAGDRDAVVLAAHAQFLIGAAPDRLHGQGVEGVQDRRAVGEAGEAVGALHAGVDDPIDFVGGPVAGDQVRAGVAHHRGVLRDDLQERRLPGNVDDLGDDK